MTLEDFVYRHRRITVLTGAGCSTDSGIPDYRDLEGEWKRASPMTFQAFTGNELSRQRYWARSMVGWPLIAAARPNPAHYALAALERRGQSTVLITQNVDGLHEAAGSRQLCALHGRVADVICLGCRSVTSRAALAQRLDELNPGWLEAHAAVASRPDGDVDLEDTAGFVVPPCDGCGGVLKPDVVFFGENVPKPRVERCYAAVEALADCDGALLVLGSSLTVMSGFRFVRAAAKLGVPVVIVNRGTTRADDLATVKLHAGTSEFAIALVGC